jgi:hypothetical protein
MASILKIVLVKFRRSSWLLRMSSMAGLDNLWAGCDWVPASFDFVNKNTIFVTGTAEYVFNGEV